LTVLVIASSDLGLSHSSASSSVPAHWPLVWPIRAFFFFHGLILYSSAQLCSRSSRNPRKTSQPIVFALPKASEVYFFEQEFCADRESHWWGLTSQNLIYLT